MSSVAWRQIPFRDSATGRILPKATHDPLYWGLPLRFWEKVRADEGGCWIWQGAAHGGGYGGFRLPGRGLAAVHRLTYESLIGPIQKGLQLDHLCRIRYCANPKHLEAVTQRENILRGESPAAKRAKQTHCKRGHEFTPDNIYWHPKRGNRHCLQCARDNRQRRRSKCPM